MNREKDNLVKNVWICSDHFEDDCFDSSWMLQSPFFFVFQNGSLRTHLGQKRQINITINSNPSTSNKSEAARIRKRYILYQL